MLRRDIKYVDKFNQHIDIMRNKLVNSEASIDFKQKTNKTLNNYQQQFSRLVQGEQIFSLTSNQGVLGEMRASIHQSEAVALCSNYR